jgi:hypothetical protein
MATGYVGFMSVEAGSGIEIADRFDPVAAWDLMVHNFRAGGLKRLGLPHELRGSIERLGEDALVDDLRAAGLLGWRTGRVGLVGRFYSNAGAYLRAAQTDYQVAAAKIVANVLSDRWPYEQYAVDQPVRSRSTRDRPSSDPPAR